MKNKENMALITGALATAGFLKLEKRIRSERSVVESQCNIISTLELVLPTELQKKKNVYVLGILQRGPFHIKVAEIQWYLSVAKVEWGSSEENCLVQFHRTID